MTTLNDLAQDRLREQHAESQAAEDAAYEKEQRRIKSRTRVIYLFMRDILKGAELPPNARIGTRVSNEYGHQIVVWFPGNLSIDAEQLYTTDAAGGELVCRKDQRWIARVHPCGAQKTYVDFIDAAIWLLGIELEETPAFAPWQLERLPPEKPATLALLDVAYRAWFMIQALGSSAIEVELRRQLDRFRCTCGKFPVEGSIHGYWCVRCGEEWYTWEDFLAWRGKQDDKVTPA